MLARYSTTPAKLARNSAAYLRSILRALGGTVRGRAFEHPPDDFLDRRLLNGQIANRKLRQQPCGDARGLLAWDQQFSALPLRAPQLAVWGQVYTVRGYRKVDAQQLVRRDALGHCLQR